MLQRSETSGNRRVEQSALWAVHRVAAECAVSTATIWRWARAGRFPAPVHLGPGVTRWRAREVAAWIASL